MNVNAPEIKKSSQFALQDNPLIADLLSEEPATIFFLSNRDYWLRDAPSGIALSRVIPWGGSQVDIRPVIALTALARTSLKEQLPSDEERTEFEVPPTGNLYFIGRVNLFGWLEDLLFRIEEELQIANGNSISEALRQKFKEKGILLSPNTTISLEENSRWLINDRDNDRMYYIRGVKGDQDVFQSPFLDFLDEIGYPGRFNFYTSDMNNERYRTIVDQATGSSYNAERDQTTKDLTVDYGFLFKRRVNLYIPRYVTILCGTSTLGTWGVVEYAASPELWVNVPGLSRLEKLPDSIDLLIRVEPDPKKPYSLNNSNLKLVAHSVGYPSRAKRRENQIKTVDELMMDYREKRDERHDIQVKNTIFPPGSLLDPKFVDNQKIVPLVGETAEKIHNQIKEICHRDSVTDPKTVLIQGETGTGKDVVAGLIAYYWEKRLTDYETAYEEGKIKQEEKKEGKACYRKVESAIQRALKYSPEKEERYLQPILNVIQQLFTPWPEFKARYSQTNCAAIPEGMVEAELFGHEPGAFTGAIGRRLGVLREADCGVCFLDEIGDLSLEIQPKLLRALANRQIRPVGYDLPDPIPIYAKIVAATNQNLKSEKFRADLLRRFPHAQQITLKPLRDRKEDILPLILYWLQMAFKEHQAIRKPTDKREDHQAYQPLRKVDIEDSALQFFLGYHYPANVASLFDLLDEIASKAGIFDELIRSDEYHDEITIRFDQIPADYITPEFQSLKKKDGEAKSFFTFIPESSDEPWFQGILDIFEEELNRLCETKAKVSACCVQQIIEETDFKSVLEGFKSMTDAEERRLGGVFRPIRRSRKMENTEKHRLLTEKGSVWEEQKFKNKEIAFLFYVNEATVSRWRTGDGLN